MCGVPDEARGQEVHAAVVAEPGAGLTSEAGIAGARERLAAYKYPRVVHLVADLPLGPCGKVLRRTLAERLAAAPR